MQDRIDLASIALSTGRAFVPSIEQSHRAQSKLVDEHALESVCVNLFSQR